MLRSSWLPVITVLVCAWAQASSLSPAAAQAALELASEELQAQRLEQFALLLDAAAATDDFVGLAVAVVSQGSVKLLRTYGVREMGGAEPVTPDTVFRIASLSKGFAGALAGLAVAESKISLDTPVSRYAPRLVPTGGPFSRLTVDHLLSHRVGLPPNAYDNLLEAGLGVDKILVRLKGVKPICRVGACYAYQNITFNLISDVLAAVYGKPYEALVREKLFGPLGMRTASFGPHGLSASPDWARPHVRKPIPGEKGRYTPWRTAEISEAYYRTPASGGVNASISDMARWLIAQMGGAPEVLPAKVLSQIHTPVVLSPAETRRQGPLQTRIVKTYYGRGWRIYDYAGETLVNHSGGVNGYAAQIAWLPKRDAGIVILSNAPSKRVLRILPAFLDIQLGLSEADWLGIKELILAGSGSAQVQRTN